MAKEPYDYVTKGSDLVAHVAGTMTAWEIAARYFKWVCLIGLIVGTLLALVFGAGIVWFTS